MSKRWSVEFKTGPQIEAVDWAFDGADMGHDCRYELHAGRTEAVERPTFDGRILTGCAYTIADILYRLEEQLQEMSYDETGRPQVAALNAAKKIREVTGVDHDGYGSPIPTELKAP